MGEFSAGELSPFLTIILYIYIYIYIVRLQDSIILAKYPPSVGFHLPSVGTAPSAPRLECLRRPFCAALGGGKNKNFGRLWRPKFRAPVAPQVSGACGAPSFGCLWHPKFRVPSAPLLGGACGSPFRGHLRLPF